MKLQEHEKYEEKRVATTIPCAEAGNLDLPVRVRSIAGQDVREVVKGDDFRRAAFLAWSPNPLVRI